jgi:hypothetical protein
MRWTDPDDRIDELEDELKGTKEELTLYKELVEYLADVMMSSTIEIVRLIENRQFDKVCKALLNG